MSDISLSPEPSPDCTLNIVLVEPEIPPNTGNIGRLCLATGSVLHLVGPLGFSLDDRQLKRAGMDYWARVEMRRWQSLDELRAAAGADGRFWYFTTKSSHNYWDAAFTDGDYLVFGRETVGLPESLLQAQSERCVGIPMAAGERSLNLATAVGIALYEALRQNRG